jgi:hypothetical protein
LVREEHPFRLGNWEAGLGRAKLAPAKLQRVSPPPTFNEIHAADLSGWDGDIRDTRLETFVQLLCSQLGERKRPTTDILDELSQLPRLIPLPLEDANASYFLRQIREAYVRMDVGLPDLDGAMALTLDSDLSDIFGETTTTEAKFDRLCEFLADTSFDDLICDKDGNLLIEPNDLERVFTIGQLAQLIERKEIEIDEVEIDSEDEDDHFED